MFETVVFTQDELNNALTSGLKYICLCDNTFVLPHCSDIFYSAIGDVKAIIDMTFIEVIEKNVVFENFTPVFKEIPKQSDFKATMPKGSGSISSYIQMYSYRSSFAGSYNITSGSSVSSFRGSFPCSSSVVFVCGYGVNLI